MKITKTTATNKDFVKRVRLLLKVHTSYAALCETLAKEGWRTTRNTKITPEYMNRVVTANRLTGLIGTSVR